MTLDKINYFKGTQRVIPPDETIQKNKDKLKIAGITRIAEITYLDRLNIPVFSAIRPTSQKGTISVYAGKGISTAQAQASAMMEGFERYSAEKQKEDSTIISAPHELKKEDYISPQSLNMPLQSKVDEIEWSICYDLIDEREYYVPSNAIFHPYDGKNNIFKSNTNGLASGNTLNEALLHAIFEVIERDAWSIFELTRKNSKQINLSSIDSEIINNILDKFQNEGIAIQLMDLTADIQIPTIAASSDDRKLKDPGLLTLGVGTHMDPEIAVIRALTEVAQSRATQIQGSREDTVRADFIRKAGYERMKKINKHYFQEQSVQINYQDIPCVSGESINENIKYSLNELKKNNIEHVLYYDLTRPELNINVVRVIIPTMELYSIDNTRPGYRFIEVEKKIT